MYVHRPTVLHRVNRIINRGHYNIRISLLCLTIFLWERKLVAISVVTMSLRLILIKFVGRLGSHECTLLESWPAICVPARFALTVFSFFHCVLSLGDLFSMNKVARIRCFGYVTECFCDLSLNRDLHLTEGSCYIHTS